MASCKMCGINIPEGQRVCSMCYGDPDHGRDGYYRRWLEEGDRQEQERREQARREQEQEDAGN